MEYVRMGVMGTAGTALKRTIPAMHKELSLCRVQAIASRNRARAEQAAREAGIGQVMGSYEELLESPDIDAVYIPLPNHMHVPWAIKALRAGKHVLCEKPVAMSAQQARELADEAARHPGLKVMEAFMYRHHDQWREAKRLVDDGSLGKVRAIRSVFSYYNTDPANIRNRPDMGGGAMMDIGCYCISLSRWLLGAEPDMVRGTVDMDPDFGTDRLFCGTMQFGARVSSFTCSTQLEAHQRVDILGTRGRMELLLPFNPPQDGETSAFLSYGGGVEEIRFECDQYAAMAAAFARSVLDDAPVPMPLSDAEANLRVHEALMRSARNGGRHETL